MNIKNVVKCFSCFCSCMYKLAFLCFFIYFGLVFLNIYKNKNAMVPLTNAEHIYTYDRKEDCFYKYVLNRDYLKDEDIYRYDKFEE